MGYLPEETLVIRMTCSEEDMLHPLTVMQWYLSLTNLFFPVSFEFLGDKDLVSVQITARKGELTKAVSALRIHYPNAVFHRIEDPIAKTVDEGKIRYISEYSLQNLCVYPLSTYSKVAKLRQDPVSVLIAALARVASGLGGLQVLIKPAPDAWRGRLLSVSESRIHDGQSSLHSDTELFKFAQAKCDYPLFAVILRAFSTAKHTIELLAGFLNQATSARQRLVSTSFNDALTADQMLDMLKKRTSFRYGMLLNAEELASLIHPPGPWMECEKLDRVDTKATVIPRIALSDGIVIGEGIEKDRRLDARIPDKLRARHVYVVGKSGTGKSTLLLNLILQDIRRGHGVGVVDPHGDLAKSILWFIPQERRDDVVWLDAADAEFPFALNPLESTRFNTIVCNDIIIVLKRLFSSSWGNRMEHILRFALLTLLESEGKKTLYDLDRLLVNPVFRHQVLATVTNPLLLDFWRIEYRSLERDIGPVKNKLSQFLMDETLRHIVAQPESKLDFPEILNSRKIMLCNLAQGELSEGTSRLLGAFLVSQIQIAAMGRAALKPVDRPPFYFYVDEFQNYTVSSFEKILSEARKYALSLTMANQYTHQLPDTIRQAVFGNVGSVISFRVGTEDGRMLSKYYTHFDDEDFLNQETGEAKAMLEKAEWDFSLKTEPPPKMRKSAEHADRDELVRLSRATYATPVDEIKRLLAGEKQTGASSQSDDDIVVDVDL